MHPLETYFLNQAGRGLLSVPVIGPIYTAPIYLQRGHGIGNFLGTLFRFVLPLLWTVGPTGVKILRKINRPTSLRKISYRNMSAMPSLNPHGV